MMNGCGIRSLVIPIPLMKPAIMPMRGESSRTIGQGTPAAFDTASVIMPKASTEPTDKSIPAVNMTTNIPMESIPFAAVCLKMFVMFRQVKNTSGWSAHKAMHIKAITMRIP